jgi:glycosyltransferase involved in cell wall biosynthesis
MFLEETIMSVISQDYQDIEYLVIDGGSTDGSVEIIRRHQDRLAYWVSEPDDGQADAINKGWRRASGSILAFLNSDDLYMPGAISRVVEAFRANPQAMLIYSQAEMISERGDVLRTLRPASDLQSMLDRFETLPQPAVFVRREAIDAVGPLDPTFHYMLDTDLFMRIVGQFEAVHLPTVVARMRMHGTSKSVAMGTAFVSEIMRLAERVTGHPANYPRFSVRPGRVLSAAHVVSAQYCYVHGAPLQALGHLWLAACQSRHTWGRIVFSVLPRLVVRTMIGRPRYLRPAT